MFLVINYILENDLKKQFQVIGLYGTYFFKLYFYIETKITFFIHGKKIHQPNI